MTSKGIQLNKRVRELFERAGFDVNPGSNNPRDEASLTLAGGKTRTLDLSATDSNLGVKIVGENDTGRRLDEPITAYVNDLAALLSVANAKAGLLVYTGAKVEVNESDRSYAQGKGIRVWGKEELEYYEVVVERIGVYAKREIIHSFGIETDEEKFIYNVFAVRFHQPDRTSTPDLFVFTMPAEALLRTCVIYRRAMGSAAAYQRMLSPRRMNSISKFLKQPNSLLPPNIIVHLSDKVEWTPVTLDDRHVLTRPNDYEPGILRIPMEYASLELIDGQHRLFGFVDADPSRRENFNLAVLGIRGLPTNRRRDTFVAINDNSRRVDPNLVAYLKYTNNEAECQSDQELMAIKVVVELNRVDPFKNKIRLLDIGKQKITLKGFSGYDLKGLLGPKGLMRLYYPNNQSQEYINVLKLYFKILKGMFPEQWRDPEKYIIFTNRGISAFLKLLRSILKTHGGQLDHETARKYLQALRDNWADSHWEIKRLKSAYVGSKGWKDFHRDLVKVIRKKYRDFKE